MIRINADGSDSEPHVSRAAKVNLPQVRGQASTAGEPGQTILRRGHGQVPNQQAVPFSE